MHRHKNHTGCMSQIQLVSVLLLYVCLQDLMNIMFIFKWLILILQRSILLDCEVQAKSLLATTFQNYKSLDELSPTGLTDAFRPIPESAAPALVPAVQIFTLLHDVLLQESQNILRNYFLVNIRNILVTLICCICL